MVHRCLSVWQAIGNNILRSITKCKNLSSFTLQINRHRHAVLLQKIRTEYFTSMNYFYYTYTLSNQFWFIIGHGSLYKSLNYSDFIYCGSHNSILERDKVFLYIRIYRDVTWPPCAAHVKEISVKMSVYKDVSLLICPCI